MGWRDLAFGALAIALSRRKIGGEAAADVSAPVQSDASPVTLPTRDPLCETTRECLWREYEASQEGIKDYDAHLFRIRTWNITVVAAFLGAFVGIDASFEAALEYAIAALTLTFISIGFWILDSLNKSMQNVHIDNCRELERELANDATCCIRNGPRISLDFQRRGKGHFRHMIKDMSDESVWPFYVPTIVLSYIVIILKSWQVAGAQSTAIDVKAVTVASVPLLFAAAMVGLSIYFKAVPAADGEE